MDKRKLLFFALVAAAVIAGPASEAKPERAFEIHLIHHTHVDIGYTEPQEEVMRKQWHNLETAMDLVDQTADMPDDARFRWNPETTWPIETWMEQASEAEKQRFVRQVREGRLGLDGLYGNLLTSLCRPEELMHSLAYKKELEELTGAPIDSAMITDVPGWSWGFVTALSRNRIKYLSVGVNRSHRIGYIRKDWSDKPFYWVSPSGKEKVLVFIHGQGYSWFHDMLNPGSKETAFTARKIMPYLKKLEARGYPYEIVPIRYAIGADNGPPDPRISEVVKEWNEKYPDVRVRLVTVSESMAEFERRYGDSIPEFSGDFTPYWEDGAASTARETALARNAAEELAQARTALALFKANDLRPEKFSEAWNSVLLFNEHTWGAFNSISDPDSEFAKTQWEWKRQRAIDADKLARELMSSAFGSPPRQKPGAAPLALNVVNTHSWEVTGPVWIEAGNFPGARVETEAGEEAPSQVASDGSLLFLAESVPPMSARKYIVREGEPGEPGQKCRVTGNTISNGSHEVTVDPQRGTISSIKAAGGGREYVNGDFRDGFNEHVYIEGRRPKWGRKEIEDPEVSVTVKDAGPLVCSIELRREAFNSNSLKTTVTMYGGLERIDIVNTLDRPEVRSKEGIHFAFPVKADNPRVRYDVAWGTVEVDEDQIKGANKNYITALRWADVSGDGGGMQFVLRDAPMFEAGEIAMDAFPLSTANFVYKWLRETRHNGAIYSYVMNNYWETNYKADQPGVTAFRYSLFPHGEYDAARNNRRALEVMRPLRAAAADAEIGEPAVSIDNENIVVQSIEKRDGGLSITLFNVSDQAQSAAFSSPAQCSETRIDGGREVLAPLPSRLDFVGHEVKIVACGP